MSKIFVRRTFTPAQPETPPAPAPRPVQPELHYERPRISTELKGFAKLFFRVTAQDQIMFAKRMAILTKSGVPLLDALKILEKQATSKSMKRVFATCIEDILNGSSLAVSLSKYRKYFGDFAVNLIEIGEYSGTLQENLTYLAEELKKAQMLRRKIVSALVYPIFIVCATIGISSMLTVYIFPKILPIFKSVNTTLPFSTRALIFISDLFLHSGLLILGAVAGLIVAWVMLLRIQKFRYYSDKMLLSVPIFGNISQSYHLANLCRTLGLLLKSGVSIVTATNITSSTTKNLVYKDEIKQLAESITMGRKVSQHMIASKKLFPAMVTQMVTVGETTGNLSESLLYLAEIYEGEVDEMTKNLSSILEPVLMVFMGIIVGFIAVSIITPIYGITQNLHP